MSELTESTARIALIGIGATAAMDAWLLILKRLNVPSLNFALLGRWVGHFSRRTWTHAAIAKAAPVPGELALGWLSHYAVGMAFAGLLVGVYGAQWMKSPSLLPALCIGIATVLVPLLVMQPAMGAGIASSRTATPVANCLRSVANHAVFGIGLYLAAALIEGLSR
jgi:hypothetical protein